jgi:hypothetical protein
MNVVTAFLSEAIPLIDELKLKKAQVPGFPLPLYKNEEHFLTVSGMGCQKVSAAIDHLAKINFTRLTPWLNVGVAGHGNASIGSAHIVAKCSEQNSPRAIYPPQLFSKIFPTTILRTLNKPSSAYQIDIAYDMEGYGFFKTASKFTTLELIQSVKFISDNPSNPVKKFDKSKVDKIIRSHIHDIIQLINEMETLASSIRPTPEVEISLSKISQFQSFTETQSHQLKKAIRHAFSLKAPIDEIEKAASQASDSRSAIRKIYQIIELYRAFP